MKVGVTSSSPVALKLRGELLVDMLDREVYSSLIGF